METIENKIITRTVDEENNIVTVKIGDSRILKVHLIKNCATFGMDITEGFIEDGELVRDYTLFQSDDYVFNIWSCDNYENFNTVSFKFDINHPLYMSLFHLLNYDDELIIDDDETKDDNHKFMVVYRRDEYIFVDFNNYVKYDFSPTSEEKFRVFIKNIRFDGRSKIDRDYKDTKYRLYKFFSEVYSKIVKDNKQISIEEYLLRSSIEPDGMESTFRFEYDVPFQRTRGENKN